MATYATIAELKAEIGITVATDDVILTALLDAASLAIDRYCNRPCGFEKDAASSYKYYVGRGLSWLRIDECMEIESVAVKDALTDTTFTAWTAPASQISADGDYTWATGDHRVPDYNNTPYTLLIVDPVGGQTSFTGGQYVARRGFRPESDTTRAVPTVRVKAYWGYATTTPLTIKQATIMQAARFYKQLQSSMADHVANVETGELEYAQELHPSVKFLLKSGRYVKPAIG